MFRWTLHKSAVAPEHVHTHAAVSPPASAGASGPAAARAPSCAAPRARHAAGRPTLCAPAPLGLTQALASQCVIVLIVSTDSMNTPSSAHFWQR